MHTFAQNFKLDYEYAGGTLNNSATTQVYYSMANYDKIAFVIYTGTLTSTASLAIQGYQRVGASGTASTLGSATTSTADDTITVVEFSAADMTATAANDRIGLLVTETGTQNAVVHSIIAIRWNTRYAGASLQS